jgi:hypothetical protein
MKSAFPVHNIRVTDVLGKNNPFSAVVFFEDVDDAKQALKSAVEYNGDVLHTAIANHKKERHHY